MTEIIIIRHGETEWNQTGRFQGQSDVPLSAQGRAQAAALGRNLVAEHVDAVYASDLSRAMETAAPLADRYGLDVIPDPLLRELHFGRWEGRFFNEINEETPDMMKMFYRNPEEVNIPESEPFADFQRRVSRRVREIAAAHRHERVVLVSHGAAVFCLRISSPCRFVPSGMSRSSIRRLTVSVSKMMGLPLLHL